MRIALIHAVQVAIDPINRAFAEQWPEAECMNLLDDRLSVDRATATELTPAIHNRIVALAAYALDADADAVLFTCSAFGPAIEDAAAEFHTQTILKPNDAMFNAALGYGERIGMLVSFQPSVASMRREFDDLVSARGGNATLDVICEPAAMEALRAGHTDRHNELLAQAAKQLMHCDAVMLGQFSTACAKPAVEAALNKPVLTSPDAAVAELKRLLT